jgi:hypothetical protein
MTLFEIVHPSTKRSTWINIDDIVSITTISSHFLEQVENMFTRGEYLYEMNHHNVAFVISIKHLLTPEPTVIEVGVGSKLAYELYKPQMLDLQDKLLDAFSRRAPITLP